MSNSNAQTSESTISLAIKILDKLQDAAQSETFINYETNLSDLELQIKILRANWESISKQF